MLTLKNIGYLIVALLFLILSHVQASAWRCEAAKVSPGKTVNGCIKIDGVNRFYRLHIPFGFRLKKKSISILIGLHGGSGTPKRFENYSQFSKLSNREKDFIAVYPEGINKHWNDGRPNVNAQVDDMNFLKRLAQHLKQNLSLSISNKVFLVGLSNGGLMAMRAACEHSGWLTGVAVVAASMSPQIASRCSNKAIPTAMVFIFGDKDTSFLSNGIQVNPVRPSQHRGTHIGIGQTIKKWTHINQCKNGFELKHINRNPNDGTRVEEKRFRGCKQPVVFYDVKNGGHRWPDSKSRNGAILKNILNLGIASHDINTAEKIWAVFKGSLD